MSKNSTDHPHLLKIENDPDGNPVYHFKPFTGEEPNPMKLYCASEIPGSEDPIYHQYCAAAEKWQVARTINRVTRALRDAEPFATAYLQARTSAQEAWQQLMADSNAHFLGNTLALVRAHSTMVETAQSLDESLKPVVQEHTKRPSPELPSLRQIAADASLDISTWPIGRNERAYDLPGVTPARTQAEKIVEADLRDLREMMDLAGLHKHTALLETPSS